MPPVTYLEFVVVVVAIPLVALAAWAFYRRQVRPTQLLGVGILLAAALVYTFPWDGFLIQSNTWTYGTSLVGRLGVVPYEELLFIAGQTVLTGLWTAALVEPRGHHISISLKERLLGVAAGGTIGLVGLIGFLTVPSLHYLGAILAWAGPVLALQWGFGWPVLRGRFRESFAALAVPTLYLWLTDRLAIGLGLWSFGSGQTTGLTLVGLPIEEAAFFLVTNLFLVQGLVLFGWIVERGVIPQPAEYWRLVVERSD